MIKFDKPTINELAAGLKTGEFIIGLYVVLIQNMKIGIIGY